MQENQPSRRADIKRAYKEAPVQAGVLLIRNLKNGKVLVSSGINAQGRLNRHRFELGVGSHECAALQADWDALGEQAFAFELAEALKPPEPANPFFDSVAALKALERAWVEKLQPFGERGYNSQAD